MIDLRTSCQGLLFLGAAAVAPMAADSATIHTGTYDGAGAVLALDPTNFTGSGPCGSGQSVVGDGCSVVVKNDPLAPHAYGRTSPIGSNWIDSQDLGSLLWNISHETAFTSVTFAITDAHDQANSWFEVSANGASWNTTGRQENGAVNWLTILLDEATTSLDVHFSTRHNDGFGISSATVAPIPLPAAAWLLVAGIATLAWRTRK